MVLSSVGVVRLPNLPKHSPSPFPPFPPLPPPDCGDFVVVINASKLRVTGSKPHDKLYYRHSGFPGGLKQRTFLEQMSRDPTFVLRSAVLGSIHKNNLRHGFVEPKLLIYPHGEHPHEKDLGGRAPMPPAPRCLVGGWRWGLDTPLPGAGGGGGGEDETK